MNPIIEAYSRLADEYDDERNRLSCWGRSADHALASIRLTAQHRVVVDVGCGTGRALAGLAAQYGGPRRWVGVDPADMMREKAVELTRCHGNIEIVKGAFECLPMDSASVDYLYSIYAFHWTTDLEGSVKELARVLKPSGTMDLFFTGRHNGPEFLRKTTPIFLKYLGPRLLLESAAMRQQLTKEAAGRLFESVFGQDRVAVSESYETYYDTLEGHWSWWVRAQGHFVHIPPERKAQCDDDIKQALAELGTDKGIPHTIHLLHVRVAARETCATPGY